MKTLCITEMFGKKPRHDEHVILYTRHNPHMALCLIAEEQGKRTVVLDG